MRRPLALCALALTLGCAPASPSSSQFASGTRLRARAWDGGDGAATFIAFHDTMLDVDCNFTTAEDGVLRCMPLGGEVDYLDAACSGARVLVPPSESCDAARPAYVSTTTTSSSSCGTPTRMGGFRVGMRLPAQTTWFGGGASCTAYTVATCPSALEPVPASTFVGARIERQPIDDALAEDVVVADDGARLVIALVDLTRDAPCDRVRQDPFTRYPDTVLDRCAPLPSAHWLNGAYLGAGCSGAMAIGIDPSCPLPGTILVWRSGACGYDLSFAEPGAAAGAAFAWSGEPPVCGPADPRAGPTFLEVGATLDPRAMPRLPTAGASRLRAGLASSDVPRFFDTELGVACAPERLADGSDRCVPYTRTVTGWPLFDDAACTRPIAAFQYDCGARPEFARVGDALTVTSIHRVVARVTPSAIYARITDGSCVPWAIDPSWTFWRLGDEVALAPVTRVLR